MAERRKLSKPKRRRKPGAVDFDALLKEVKKKDFDTLVTIAALTAELGYSPPLTALAKACGWPGGRQGAQFKVKRLRERGLLEEPDFRGAIGVKLSHNGKLLLETGFQNYTAQP